MPLVLYNTLHKKKEVFDPIDKNRITMYVCGPTVYSYAHIGNARPAVVFDILFRLLRYHFSNVIYVRNITDIDDKINNAAQELGVPISQITEKYAKIYSDDMKALGNKIPTHEPRVTENMEEIIQIIKTLVENGHAYYKKDHVLFHVPSFEKYGALSGRDTKDLLAGARVESAPYKKDTGDFVLWKPSDDNAPGWPSPWGRGRPGWHIECTGMSRKYLGEVFDIHGGGMDLIFPHHENEIAQGACSSKTQDYCRYWVHNGFVKVEGQKMSKSLGNVLLVHELIKEHKGEVLRYCLLSSHYRQPLNWTENLLQQGKEVLDKFYRTIETVEQECGWAMSGAQTMQGKDICPEIIEALNDDLNMSKVFAVLHKMAADARRETDPKKKIENTEKLISAAQFIGLLNSTPAQWFQKEKIAVDKNTSNQIDAEKIEMLIQERFEARNEKNFKRADEIRDTLKEMGIVLEDKPDGTDWKPI